MGGRSYRCSFCSKGFLEAQALHAHERLCVVQRHERIVPYDVPIPQIYKERP